MYIQNSSIMSRASVMPYTLKTRMVFGKSIEGIYWNNQSLFQIYNQIA